MVALPDNRIEAGKRSTPGREKKRHVARGTSPRGAGLLSGEKKRGMQDGSEESGALVLLVEDEPAMQRLLEIILEGQGYRVIVANTGAQGLVHAATRNPDLVLLDLGLPDMEGEDVIRRLREWWTRPIVVISARGREEEKVRVLDAGADDYVTKPFDVREMAARLRVALRHGRAQAGGAAEAVIAAGPVVLDSALRKVTVEEQEIRLTPTEYRLLSLLLRNADRVLTHGQILREVWGPAYANQVSYLRVYMAQLRQKIEKNPARPVYLLNEPGIGYRFCSSRSPDKPGGK